MMNKQYPEHIQKKNQAIDDTLQNINNLKASIETSLRKRKIVIIDDDDEWCEEVSLQFSLLGEKVICVSHAYDLGRVIQKNNVKGVLVDLQLGDGDRVGLKILEMLGGEKFPKVLIAMNEPDDIPNEVIFLHKNQTTKDFVLKVVELLNPTLQT